MATYLNYTMCGMGDASVGLLVIESSDTLPGDKRSQRSLAGLSAMAVIYHCKYAEYMEIPPPSDK